MTTTETLDPVSVAVRDESRNRTVIRRFVAGSRWVVMGLAACRGMLKAAPMLLVLLLVGLGDRFFPLELRVRQAAWLAVVVIAALLFVSGFWPFDFLSLRSLSRRWASRARRRPTGMSSSLRSDDLRLAVEFSNTRPGATTSAELVDLFLERIAARLSTSRVWWAAPEWRWRGPGIGAASTLLIVSCVLFMGDRAALVSRILFPFSSGEMNRWVLVQPGDATVMYGSDVDIRVELRRPVLERPTLEVRGQAGWMTVEPTEESGLAQRFVMKSVVAPLLYRVEWRGERTSRFTLTPIKPITLDAFHVSVRPPEYTGKPAVTQTQPEISGLAGSVVAVGADASERLRRAVLRSSDGRQRPVEIDGRTLRTSFVIEKEGTYWFEMESSAGSSPVRSDSYPIHLLPDAPPQITLLSPDQDLTVGENEKIALTFDVRDDFGLDEVALLWTDGATPEKRRVLAHYGHGDDGGIRTFNWDLREAGARSGRVVRYSLEAVDRNVVTGPGRTRTAPRVIEITSFDREHENIEKALEKWRDNAVDTLAALNTLKAKTDKTPELPTLTNDLNQAAALMKQLESSLKQIVSRMDNDPLADYGSSMEHRAMADSLESLNQGAMKDVQAAFQTKNAPLASQRLEDVAAEVERMAALSEDLSKSQRARDVVDRGEKLEELGNDLVKTLSEDKLDAESRKKVQDLLSEAQKKLAEIARSLQDMPKDLPDDFVNQQALKQLPLQKSADLMSEIQKAMESGDAATALKLARQFLDAVTKMSGQLSKAHESFTNDNSAAELSKKIAEKAAALQKITDEQRALMSETQELESKRLERQAAAERDLLVTLAARQKKVIEKSQALYAAGGWPSPLLTARLGAQFPAMQGVLSEFEAKRVERSATWLGAIVTQLGALETDLAVASAPVSVSLGVKDAQSEEAAILELLSRGAGEAPPSTVDEQGKFAGLETRQSALSRQTQNLRQQLQALARKTASLGVPVTQGLGRASQSMADASHELGRQASRPALHDQEDALAQLLESQSAMEQAQAAMGEMAQNQGGGQGGGPRMVIRGGGAPGPTGTRNAKVRLPSAEDYRPPREFREDLLESLKEHYPKIYEEIIHQYYKRLSQ